MRDEAWEGLIFSPNLVVLLMIGFDEFSVLSWNVRGALGEAGQLFIKDIVGYKKPDIVILVETRCQFSRARYFWQRMGYDPIGVEEARGFSGGIWVLKQTNSMFNMRLRSLHQQVVTIELWRENMSWVCSAIYASPAPALRDCLWDQDCAHSKEIWLRFGALSWTHFNDPNLYSWIHILATGPNSMKFLAALWGNWKWRKNMALDDEKWTLEVAWRRICHDHDDWCSSYDWGGNHSNHFLSKVWAPPLEGWVKVNTDGSYHDDRKMMGYGGLVRDHASGWIKGFLGCCNGGSAFISEAWALMEGINLAWSLGFRKVICEVDSADLLAALENTETRNCVHEIDEIRLGMDKDWQIVLCRIPRDSNGAADCMATFASKGVGSTFQVLDLPFIELETLILMDKLRASSFL
ncbi:unnamed protein product [Lupinus luteus]|uniref:RNase H type-1 domain-containing protein n=1 Tax=Lupinus luteus TaxID=3873 RepID=A0AAV1XU69_LUPLU